MLIVYSHRSRPRSAPVRDVQEPLPGPKSWSDCPATDGAHSSLWSSPGPTSGGICGPPDQPPSPGPAHFEHASAALPALHLADDAGGDGPPRPPAPASLDHGGIVGETVGRNGDAIHAHRVLIGQDVHGLARTHQFPSRSTPSTATSSRSAKDAEPSMRTPIRTESTTSTRRRMIPPLAPAPPWTITLRLPV